MRIIFATAAICSSLFLHAGITGIFPADASADVNIDTPIRLVFDSEPVKGISGTIVVTDMATGEIVDSIDISLPDGLTESRTYPDECHYTYTPYDYARIDIPTNRTCMPGTPSGEAEPTPRDMQLNIIGGFTDGFRYHPVLVRGNAVNIALHNNVLDYGHTYRVDISPDVLPGNGNETISWTFTTKEAPTHNDIISVKADGTGDFTTLQGALDAIPDFCPDPTTITVGAGDFEEIVYARNKTNITICGAGMDSTVVHYPNNEVFNPHPVLVKTNEYPGTFPSRRAAVMFDNCHDIVIKDITMATDLTGQAEGLLLNGERIALYGVHIIGSGDALQANGTVYLEDCEIDGHGDTILGRGSVFALRCALRNEGGPFSWVRNTQGHHGDVFVECTFSCPDGRLCDYGRTPVNKTSTYPFAEIVLIDCGVQNLNPAGWSAIGEPTARMLEYNTVDLATGLPADTSMRHPFSRQLEAEADAATIACYRNPAFVLKGWHPKAYLK